MFEMFEVFVFIGNIFVYFWCVLYYELLFLMRVSDAVSFSVYMKILLRYFMIFLMLQKCD